MNRVEHPPALCDGIDLYRITSRSHVISTRTVASDSGLSFVSNVFSGERRVLGTHLSVWISHAMPSWPTYLQISHKDRFAVGIGKGFAFGVSLKLDRLATSSVWQRCKCVFYCLNLVSRVYAIFGKFTLTLCI